ncbi:MAG: hypothetical protein L3K18_00315 [Thermoplasmata archaeon]|nr:hypothetical protein [Thermoplasmata archaeon]MCI4355575.1 hypothetical protein [Thermoplasmata archaeon]
MPATARAVSASAAAPEVGHLPPRWDPTPIRPSLPVGVALLSVLIAIGGLVVLISGLLFLLKEYLGTAIPTQLLIVHQVDVVGAAVLVLLGAVLLGVATALWNQEAWALYTTVVVLFLALGYLFFTSTITVVFLLFLVLFVYLLAVRHHFF